MQGKVATQDIVPSILQRAKKCFQRGRSREAMAKLYNSLVASLNEFNALARLIPIVDLSQHVDMVIAKKYAYLFGITQNDPKHRLYLWQQHHGHNLRSMATAMLQSAARELLVRLTHVGLRTPAMMRSRVAAIDLDPDAQNYTCTAIKELATYGIFLRDNTEPLHTRVMQILLHGDPGYCQPLGTAGYRNRNWREKKPTCASDLVLGDGHPTIGHLYCLGGPIDRYIRHNTPSAPVFHHDPHYTPEICTVEYWRSKPIYCPNSQAGCSPTAISKAFRTALAQIRLDIDAQTKFYEWRRTYDDRCPLTSPNWRLIQRPTHNTITLPEDIPNIIPTFIEQTRLDAEELHRHVEYSFDPRTNQPTPLATADASIINYIRQFRSPPILASDAGLTTINGTDFVVATAGLHVANLTTMPNPTPDQWEPTNAIPLLLRTKILPKNFGTNKATNNIGELIGLTMQHDLMPVGLPTFACVDSRAVQDKYRQLRDKRHELTHRNAIRHVFPSISASQMTILDQQCRRLKGTDWTSQYPDIAAQISTFQQHAINNWPGRTNDLIPHPVQKEAIDTEMHNPLNHIHSHQLNNQGTLKRSTTNPASHKEVPSRLLLTANH